MLDAESALSELSDLLICPNCSGAYDEPKVLPCGQIVCTECIAIILYRINKTCKEFKCLLCTDYHKLPMGAKMEFPTCEPLLKLIKKRSTTLNKDLKSNLAGLWNKMNQLKKDVNCGNETDFFQIKLNNFSILIFVLKRWWLDKRILWKSKELSA